MSLPIKESEPLFHNEPFDLKNGVLVDINFRVTGTMLIPEVFERQLHNICRHAKDFYMHGLGRRLEELPVTGEQDSIVTSEQFTEPFGTAELIVEVKVHHTKIFDGELIRSLIRTTLTEPLRDNIRLLMATYRDERLLQAVADRHRSSEPVGKRYMFDN